MCSKLEEVKVSLTLGDLSPAVYTDLGQSELRDKSTDQSIRSGGRGYIRRGKSVGGARFVSGWDECVCVKL